MLKHVTNAILSEPWAIMPAWLEVIWAIATRNCEAPALEAHKEWEKRDFDLMFAAFNGAAGPAIKMPGAHRSYMIDGVAMIPVVGPIFPRSNMMTEMSGATSISSLTNDYRLALESKDVGAVMFLMDSPGGAVSGVNAFADMVHAGSKIKETAVHVTGLAASAAYWIASSARQIFAEKSAMLGSIGIVATTYKQVEPDGRGEMRFEIVSSGAPNKRPDPSTEEGHDAIRSMLDEIEGLFVADVARGRNVSTDKVLSDFGQGGIIVGKKAMTAGMADKVQSQDASFTAMRRAASNYRRAQSLRQD